MRLNSFTDFGLRAMMLLASRPEEVLSANAIARELGLSANHIAKILKHLTAEGLLVSVRGAQGGVSLARPPEQIKVAEIFRLLDQEALVVCFRSDSDEKCSIEPACRLKIMLSRAQRGFMRELEGYSLRDCIA